MYIYHGGNWAKVATGIPETVHRFNDTFQFDHKHECPHAWSKAVALSASLVIDS